MPSPESASEAIYRALSLHIGNGKTYSVDDIHAATGIPARNVSAWIAGSPESRRSVKAQHLLMLCSFLGESFTSKVLGVIGMGAHSLEPEAGSPGVIIARLINGTSQFATRGADHVYCNVDLGALEPVADDMITILQPFSTKGR